MTELEEKSTPQWCLVGNIVNERPFGEGGEEVRRGTRHFAPRTKVYCLPAQWGDGYEKIVVIGLHRGSRRFVKMVIRSDWVSNWRAAVVYKPQVLRLLDEEARNGRPTWDSKTEVEACAGCLKEESAHGDHYVP